MVLFVWWVWRAGGRSVKADERAGGREFGVETLLIRRRFAVVFCSRSVSRVCRLGVDAHPVDPPQSVETPYTARRHPVDPPEVPNPVEQIHPDFSGFSSVF